MAYSLSPSGGSKGVKFRSENDAVVYSSVCSGSPAVPRENLASTGGQREPAVHEIALLSSDFSSTTCQLISECHSIFCSLQDVAANASSTAKPNSLLHVSRQYRAVLHACLLNARPKSSGGSAGTSEAAVFSEMELIWHLCEIIFLEVLPVGCVMQPLLEWVRWHCQHVDERATALLHYPDPASHHDFWNTVNVLVLHGRVDTARDLLAHLPSRKTSASMAYGSLDELLRKMPIPQALFGQSLTEFSLRWKRWQQECRNRYAEGEFSSTPQLQHIVQMLTGDSTALQACRPLCDSWYEVMVGTLLYTNPTVKAVDMQYSLTTFLDDGYRTKLNPADSILKSVFEFDIPAVLRQTSESFGPCSSWFAAHLTDLLHHCGKLEARNAGYGMDQREYLLLEFASSLMSHDSFWQAGVSYFDHCSVSGRSHIELLIQRVPLTSERKAQKVLAVCKQRDLTDTANSVCRVMAMQQLRYNRIGSALNWCLRCKDSSFAAFLANRLLSQYSADGVFEHLDLIDNLGPAMLLNNRLTFLAQYHQFHRLYNDQEFQQAGSLLFSLLDSRLAPKQLWPTMLLDALPLLEMQRVIFNGEQTYELMYCLEEVQNSANTSQQATAASASSRLNGFMNGAAAGGGGMESSDEAMDTGMLGRKQLSIGQLMDKLALLRLALARNLARAIVSDTDS